MYNFTCILSTYRVQYKHADNYRKKLLRYAIRNSG